MVLDESLIPEIVRRIRTVTEPDRIILFGSAASGQMSPDSDMDILVVAPTPANARDESVRIRRALGDLGHPVDVIVIATECFEETKGVIGGIAYPADKFGKVLYAVA